MMHDIKIALMVVNYMKYVESLNLIISKDILNTISKKIVKGHVF